jgi:4-hydroxybenzoate polyprenyltransferase
MIKLIFDILRLVRPRQWIKNFAIFAAITFAGELFDPPIFRNVLFGFFVFCGLSSATYIINDIFDAKKDRLHPFKKFRPLAHGDIPIPLAAALAVFLIVVSLIYAQTITPTFFITAITYLGIQFL